MQLRTGLGSGWDDGEGVDGGRILVVDTDPMFAILVEACLGFEGASVHAATSLSAAADDLSSDLTGVVLAAELLDGDAAAFAAHVHDRYPELPLVICTDGDP